MNVPAQDPRLVVEIYTDTDADTPDRGKSYLHCDVCLREQRELFSDVTTPKDYARQQIATTSDGFQVMCTRHNINIAVFALRAVKREKPRNER